MSEMVESWLKQNLDRPLSDIFLEFADRDTRLTALLDEARRLFEEAMTVIIELVTWGCYHEAHEGNIPEEADAFLGKAEAWLKIQKGEG